MSIVARKPEAETRISSAFDREFALEILKSDKLRVTILIGAVSATMLLTLCLSVFAYEEFQGIFRGHFKSFLVSVLVVMGLTLACLFLERAAINRRISQQGRALPFLQYLSAFIETSIPTVGMIIAAHFLGPIYTLFTPAAFVYPLMIVLRNTPVRQIQTSFLMKFE